MAFTTKEVEELEVAPPQPITIPHRESDDDGEPDFNPIHEPEPVEEPVPA